MKTIVAGSRDITDLKLVTHTIETVSFEVTEVVSGRARGVDTLGEVWAEQNKIPIQYFPADWNKFGRGAGPIRNREMAEYADALIAVWDGVSRGTRNMIELAKTYGLVVEVYNTRENKWI